LKIISAKMDADCARCGGCRIRCAFLQKYDNPGEIAKAVRSTPQSEWPDPFECSLCGLCGSVCSEELKPDALFLEMRRAMVEAGVVELDRYAPLLSFEEKGKSDQYSLFRLPQGGDTVLFPGCGLSETRPKTVRHLFQALALTIPDLGIVLDCCLKPSHDLGRQAFFEEHFEALHKKLIDAGVKRILTSCPNCFKVFKAYCPDIRITTVYEVLADAGYIPESPAGGSAVVHDPCPGRYESGTQEAVRTLASACGIELSEMENNRKFTHCCGEGGAVRFVNEEFSANWTDQRVEQADGRRIITSCAGCNRFLGDSAQVDHILEEVLGTKARFSLPWPLSSLTRLWLKRWFRKNVSG